VREKRLRRQLETFIGKKEDARKEHDVDVHSPQFYTIRKDIFSATLTFTALLSSSLSSQNFALKKLEIPKKTKLFVDAAVRERQGALNMHR